MLKTKAAVPCSPVSYRLVGVGLGIWVTGMGRYSLPKIPSRLLVKGGINATLWKQLKLSLMF